MKRFFFPLPAAMMLLFACETLDQPGETPDSKPDIKYVKEITTEVLSTDNFIKDYDLDSKISFVYDDQMRPTKVTITRPHYPRVVTGLLDYSKPGRITCKCWIDDEIGYYLWSSVECSLNSDNLIESASTDWAITDGRPLNTWDYYFTYQDGYISSLEKKRTDVEETIKYSFSRDNGILKYSYYWKNGSYEESGNDVEWSYKWGYPTSNINYDWNLQNIDDFTSPTGGGTCENIAVYAPIFFGYAGKLSDKLTEYQSLFSCTSNSSSSSTKIDEKTYHRVYYTYIGADDCKKTMKVESNPDGTPAKIVFEYAPFEEWCYESDYVWDETKWEYVTVEGSEKQYKASDFSGSYSRIIYFSYI